MLQTQELCPIQSQQTRQTNLNAILYSQVTKQILQRPLPLRGSGNSFCKGSHTGVFTVSSVVHLSQQWTGSLPPAFALRGAPCLAKAGAFAYACDGMQAKLRTIAI